MRKAYKKIKPTELATSASASGPAVAGLNSGSVTVVNTVNTDTRHAGDSQDHGSGDGQHDDEPEEEEKEGEPEPPSPQVHPQRQAMLDDGDDDGNQVRSAPHGTNKADGDEPSEDGPRRKRQREWPDRRNRKPGYFDEALTMAERKKAEAAERAAEQERRAAERQRKTEDRERFRRAMAKARKPGRDGQRRLGRESGILLEKVKKMVT